MNARNPEKPALISVVIPVYNDEKHQPIMCAELARVFAQINESRELPYRHEVIFVDDGSRNHAWQVIEETTKEFEVARGIRLSRNFGKLAALEAGLHEAKGDAVITMDSDLEDPPSFIPNMIREWENGHEIVGTKRVYCKKKSFLKRKTSDLFYWVFNTVCDTKIESGMSEFSLIDRQVLETLKKFGEHNLYYKAFLGWVGFNSTVLEYQKGNREFGESSYNFRRLVDLAWSGLSSFSTFPLRFLVMLGGTITILSGLLLVGMATIRWVLQWDTYSDIAFLVVFIIFSNGLILAAIGVVALYLMEIHHGVKGRPNYIIWKKTNL